MIERKIQTETYWRTEFAVADEDMAYLDELFLERQRPLTLETLSRSLIAERCQREESLIRRQLDKGTIYRPNASFQEGERLVFPDLDFAVGVMVGQRDGHNPEYQSFQVIAVEFEDAEDVGPREFAAGLKEPHKLAYPDEVSWESVYSISPDVLGDSYGGLVAAKLGQRLEDEAGYAKFRGLWFPASMAADVHVGLLNIAEAMLVIQEKPLPPRALLNELDLPEEIPEEVRVFSLNCVISRDERFEDVGDEDQVIWALRRWIPKEVIEAPERLPYKPVSYDRTGLDVIHLQMERELDDETSRLMAPPAAAVVQDLTVLLTYPHWRHGTLPLTARTSVFFPRGALGQHTQITFLDKINGTQFPGWVVREHQYVYGLADWYEANNIPAGAYIKLVRTSDPHAVGIDIIPRRMQREWARTISKGEDDELSFTMQKRPIACEYDELCLLDEPVRTIGDALWALERARERPLDDLVTAVFAELAKLTPSVAVHGKTLYAAVNVLRRCPPGLVFSTLFGVPGFITTGDGYWIHQGGI